MKNQIRKSVVCLVIGAMLVASGCSSKESRYTVGTVANTHGTDISDSYSEMTTTEDLSHDPSTNRVLSKRFGQFDMAQGWVEVDEHSTDPYYYTYVYDGTAEYEYPNNITVYASICDYQLDESVKLKQDILDSLNQQASEKKIDVEITDSSIITESGMTVLCFNMVKDTNRTIQYYILGEKQYVMVSVSIYDEEQAKNDRSEEVALAIVNSFVWSENGIGI